MASRRTKERDSTTVSAQTKAGMAEEYGAVSEGSGLLFVLSQPKPSLPLDEYHEWYNKEYGPLQSKLNVVLNGYRYKSRELEPPVWLACYDLARVASLSKTQYTTLQGNRSDRDSHAVNRHLSMLDCRAYSDFSTRGSGGVPASVLLAVRFVVKDEDVKEIDDWYEQV